MKVVGFLTFFILALSSMECSVSASPFKYKQDLRKSQNDESSAVPWRKLNSSPVCFGAKDNQYGKFLLAIQGKLAAIKLVHLYGYVTCDTRHVSYWSYWGCGSYPDRLGLINVVITNSANQILLPPREFIIDNGAKWSKAPGYDSFSPELVLSFFKPYPVHWRHPLLLWYGEDLMNAGEGGNGGNECIDVYGLFL